MANKHALIIPGGARRLIRRKDNALTLAIVYAILDRFSGEEVKIPKQYELLWEAIVGELEVIENAEEHLSKVRAAAGKKGADALHGKNDLPANLTCQQNGFASKNDLPVDRKKDGETDGETDVSPPHKPPRGGEAVDADFERFWEAYGRRGVRKTALAAFRRAEKSPTWPGVDAVCEMVAALRQSVILGKIGHA